MIDCNLPQWVTQLWIIGKLGVYNKNMKSFRNAYVPYLTKLRSLIIEIVKENKEINDFINSVSGWIEIGRASCRERVSPPV